MNFVDLASTRIARAGYDPATREMVVEFHKGGSYRYPNVQPHEFEHLTTAYSPGMVFDMMFRGRTDHSRME